MPLPRSIVGPALDSRPAVASRNSGATRIPNDRRRPRARGGGISAAHDITYPLSGFKAIFWQLPRSASTWDSVRLADLQITGGPYNYFVDHEPRAGSPHERRHRHRDSTHSVEDIRNRREDSALAGDSRSPGRFRFTTRLPNASRKSASGQETDRFQRLTARREDSAIHRVVGKPWLDQHEPAARRHTAER